MVSKREIWLIYTNYILFVLVKDDETIESAGESEGEAEIANVPSSSGFVAKSDDILNHGNYPYIMETFKDPETGLEKIQLLILLIGGALEAKLELDKAGEEVIVKYMWPKMSFNIEDLFKKAIQKKEITAHHPSILCLKNGLEKKRSHIDKAPESFLRIKLPFHVQTGIQNYKVSGVSRQDGTYGIIGTFTGYVKAYNNKIADTTIKFDM